MLGKRSFPVRARPVFTGKLAVSFKEGKSSQLGYLHKPAAKPIRILYLKPRKAKINLSLEVSHPDPTQLDNRVFAYIYPRK